MPTIAEIVVAIIVGKIISAGDIEFIVVRSPITDVGINCTLVALITKNIIISKPARAISRAGFLFYSLILLKSKISS